MRHEKKIIETLSSASAQPSTYFKESLRRKVINLSLKEDLVMEKPNLFSKFKYAPVLATVLIVVVGVGALLNMSNKDSDKTLTEDATDTVSESMSMIAPTSRLATVDEARAAVDFDLLLPTLVVGSEEITGIEQYDGGNGNALTFIYGTGDETDYRFSARPTSENYFDETAELVTISFGDADITAHYSYFGEPSDDENAIAFDGGGAMARSLLTWEIDGVIYEILEYGTISSDQLVLLAESLQ